MNRTVPRPLTDAFSGDQFKPTVILFSAPVLMLTWRYFGSLEFYLQRIAPFFAPQSDPTAGATAYYFISCFILFAIVPALIVKLLFRENLSDYGVQLGDRRILFRSMILSLPIIAVLAYLSSKSPEILKEYPIYRNAGKSPGTFGSHALTYFLFYIGWEFYFRGFMQCGLQEKLGATNALGIQVLASTMLHIGKPWPETFGAIAGGILWGTYVFRTKSILSGLWQHFLLGLALDFFICYG